MPTSIDTGHPTLSNGESMGSNSGMIPAAHSIRYAKPHNAPDENQESVDAPKWRKGGKPERLLGVWTSNSRQKHCQYEDEDRECAAKAEEVGIKSTPMRSSSDIRTDRDQVLMPSHFYRRFHRSQQCGTNQIMKAKVKTGNPQIPAESAGACRSCGWQRIRRSSHNAYAPRQNGGAGSTPILG